MILIFKDDVPRKSLRNIWYNVNNEFACKYRLSVF